MILAVLEECRYNVRKAELYKMINFTEISLVVFDGNDIGRWMLGTKGM